MVAAFDVDFVVLQVASIRQHLASIYEKEEDWRNAAQVLVGIPLETGQKYVHPVCGFICTCTLCTELDQQVRILGFAAPEVTHY